MKYKLQIKMKQGFVGFEFGLSKIHFPPQWACIGREYN